MLVSVCFANYILQGSSFATGVEVQEKRKKVLIISTGSKSVDGVLGGRLPWHVDPCAN